MELKLKETANLLGKSERQIRYMIQKGEIKASKKNGEWTIDRETLPFTDRQLLEASHKKQIFTDNIEKVVEKLALKKEFTFKDLRSFQLCYALYREFEKDTLAGYLDLLSETFLFLALGYHTFNTKDKTGHYNEAKVSLCKLLIDLFRDNHKNPSPKLKKYMDVLEKDILPAINGLIKALEKKDRWNNSPKYQRY